MNYDRYFIAENTPWHEFPAAGKCHDCGRPSRTYRCGACKEKFMLKHGGLSYGMPEYAQSLSDIFKSIRRDRMFSGMRK